MVNLSRYAWTINYKLNLGVEPHRMELIVKRIQIPLTFDIENPHPDFISDYESTRASRKLFADFNKAVEYGADLALKNNMILKKSLPNGYEDSFLD